MNLLLQIITAYPWESVATAMGAITIIYLAIRYGNIPSDHFENVGSGDADKFYLISERKRK